MSRGLWVGIQMWPVSEGRWQASGVKDDSAKINVAEPGGTPWQALANLVDPPTGRDPEAIYQRLQDALADAYNQMSDERYDERVVFNYLGRQILWMCRRATGKDEPLAQPLALLGIYRQSHKGANYL